MKVRLRKPSTFFVAGHSTSYVTLPSGSLISKMVPFEFFYLQRHCKAPVRVILSFKNTYSPWLIGN